MLGGFVLPARADLVVSIGSTSIPQGGTGSIDVLLTSTASPSSPDLVNNLGFKLQITGPNELQFSTSQSFSYLTNSQYVFFGDSTDQMTSSPGGVVTKTVYPNDTFAGSDSTSSTNPVSLSSSNTPVLLARLSLDAGITNASDSYTISLVPTAGNGSMANNASTFFDVFDFSTGGETSAVPFTSTPGTVNITAPVPEPGSLVYGVSGLVLLAGSVGANRRRRA
jgi:hypothetical protein